MHFLALGPELTVLTQEQADYIGVKVEVPFKGGHHRCWIQGSVGGVVACSDGENRRGSRSGRTLRGSSSSAGRPRHESSISKNYLESSSIEKNCLRSSSTWTSGVHRDKESLPNSKVKKPDWYTSDQSSRRDCRVSTSPGSWIGAQRRV